MLYPLPTIEPTLGINTKPDEIPEIHIEEFQSTKNKCYMMASLLPAIVHGIFQFW
jgi:hypothetical protein